MKKKHLVRYIISIYSYPHVETLDLTQNNKMNKSGTISLY